MNKNGMIVTVIKNNLNRNPITKKKTLTIRTMIGKIG